MIQYPSASLIDSVQLLRYIFFQRRGQMKQRSYDQLQIRYGGRFIARLNGRVVASAKTSRALFAKLDKWHGKRGLLIEYIEPKGAICIYLHGVSARRKAY